MAYGLSGVQRDDDTSRSGTVHHPLPHAEQCIPMCKAILADWSCAFEKNDKRCASVKVLLKVNPCSANRHFRCFPPLSYMLAYSSMPLLNLPQTLTWVPTCAALLQEKVSVCPIAMPAIDLCC